MCEVGDIVEDILTVCRQKTKAETRMEENVLLKHIQTNIFDQVNDLLQV